MARIRERFIRKTLKRLSKQRVELMLKPGGPWVIVGLVSEGEAGVAEALRTCHMRGWVEFLHDAVPQREIKYDAAGNPRIPDRIHGIAPLYRLTDSGWNQIRGVHSWLVLAAIVAVASLLATSAGVGLQLYLSGPPAVSVMPPTPVIRP